MAGVDKINVYKLNSTAKTFSHFLKNATGSEIKISENLTISKVFKQHGGKTSTEDTINWISFLNEKCTGEEKISFTTINNFPSAAVGLKIKIDNKYNFFCLTFGIGAEGLINTEYIINDFGIKVGMNICDPEKLRRIQTTVHENVTTQTERQVSTGTSIEYLNIDNEKEFLKNLSGSTNADFEMISSFKGKESINLKYSKEVPLAWKALEDLLPKLNTLYFSEKYKTVFKNYDKFHLETDSNLIDELDQLVFEKIRLADYSNIHLAPPEFFDFDEYQFGYSNDLEAEKFDDLSLNDLFREKKLTEKSNLETIKKWKIFKCNLVGALPTGWSVYKCLVAEINHKEKNYILSNGQWKEASPSFAKEIDEYIKKIKTSEVAYLKNNVSIYCEEKKSNREEIYNRDVSKNPNIFLFDKAKIEIAGQKRFEMCDLLHKDNTFIHVKKFASGTASISHLFLQGRFYTDAFILDPACRAGMQDYILTKLGEDSMSFTKIIPIERKEINTNKYTIIFCILVTPENFEIYNLPFMAKYELMKSHKYITNNYGFNCEVAIKRIK